MDNRADSLMLLIRKPMSFFIFAHMFAEDLRETVANLFLYTVRIWRELYIGSSSFASIVLTTA